MFIQLQASRTVTEWRWLLKVQHVTLSTPEENAHGVTFLEAMFLVNVHVPVPAPYCNCYWMKTTFLVTVNVPVPASYCNCYWKIRTFLVTVNVPVPASYCSCYWMIDMFLVTVHASVPSFSKCWSSWISLLRKYISGWAQVEFAYVVLYNGHNARIMRKARGSNAEQNYSVFLYNGEGV
jgi:hypothetical protein